MGAADVTLPKPPHGQPCNNCGLCCQEELCPLGAHLFGYWEGPCSALEPNGDASFCGLIAHPEAYSLARTLSVGRAAMIEAAMSLIGSGIGCDCQVEGEPPNEAFSREMLRTRNPSRTRRALRIWGLDKLAKEVR